MALDLTTEPAEPLQGHRGILLARLLEHCDHIPDPREVFDLLDLLREMGAVTADEAANLMHAYWQA